MSSLLDEFVALRKHLAENFIENGILEKNKADRRKYGVFETKMGVFCYGFHGSGSIFFDIFRRTIVDIQSFEKWKLFSIQNLNEFANSRGFVMSEVAAEILIEEHLRFGLIKKLSKLTYEHS